jgi:transcriptional regulator with XRE-family HTH domain
MARAALGWSLDELGKAAKVHRDTISNFESAIFTPDTATLQNIRRALEDAGIAFIDGAAPGVRLRKR